MSSEQRAPKNKASARKNTKSRKKAGADRAVRSRRSGVVSQSPSSAAQPSAPSAFESVQPVHFSQPQQSAFTHSLSAEQWLERALAAKSPEQRVLYASKGLAHRAPMDTSIQSLLLRQLYMGQYEAEQFELAKQTAEQMISLGVMLDVCHQDASRAWLALGNVDEAVEQLRRAARVAPVRRRGFHFWSLGSVLFLVGRLREAEVAMNRALRWAAGARPLYEAQLALIRLHDGKPVEDAEQLVDELEQAPCGQGYGRFVLGMLSIKLGMHAKGREYLQVFVSRTLQGRKAMSLSLAGELDMAQRALGDTMALSG